MSIDLHELQKAVLKVTSNDSDNSRFGSAFAFYEDEQGTYFLTCRHVVTDVGGPAQARVDDQLAKVVASGSENDADDLAVLRVKDFRDVPLLKLNVSAKTGSPVKVMGLGYEPFVKQFVVRPLGAQLGERIGLETRQRPGRVVAWDLAIEGDYDLEEGYSGGPVIEEDSGDVIGIATYRLGGRKGMAIAVETLETIYKPVGGRTNTIPTGTVTFLFTDIEGSSAMWEDHPEQMQIALARHDEILHAVIQACGGFVFKMVGDACCAAFDNPRDALKATLAAQRALFAEPWDEGTNIRVRMTLHTGMPEERNDDYFGPPVNRVARLLNAGYGGQILLSSVTYGLVRDVLRHMEPGAELRELGEYRLRDLAYPDRIFQLVVPDLPPDFPPLKGELITAESIPTDEQQTSRPGEMSAVVPKVSPISSRLPDTASYIVGRGTQLEQLDGAWKNPDVHVIAQVAQGGVGKSAVINEWLSRLGDHFGGADIVYAWSFHDQGVTDRVVSADSFIEDALKFFGDADPNQGTPQRKGERLAQCIQEYSKPLLIIDGLEPLQRPPGPGAGKIQDDSVRALLRELGRDNPGLCVIASRLPVADLGQFEGKYALTVDLERLSTKAGADLLSSQEITGSQEELEKASTYYGGHALALTLLAGHLKVFSGGDIHNWRENVSLLDQDKEEGGRWEDVMHAYERWFGEEGAALAVWRLLGLFDRPVDERFLRVEFLKSDPIYGLTDIISDLSDDDWLRIVDRLSTAQLLSKKGYPPQRPKEFTLDVHPLIREYFGEQLKDSRPEAWREGNGRLSELFVKRYKDASNEQPTIKDMEPLFQATIHACKADRHYEALHQVYLPLIMRGEDEAYAENKLGAIGSLHSVISYFFEGDWGKPVQQLSEADKLLVLTDAGRYLTQIKGYAAPEVGECYKAAKTLSDETKEQNLRHFFEAKLGLSRFYRVGGQFDDSYREATDLESLYCQLEKSQPDTTRSTLYPTVFSAVQRALATYYYYSGCFVEAVRHAEKGAISYNDNKALLRARLDINEPSILCLSYQAAALWFRGEPDKALRMSKCAVDQALELDHAHTLAIALLLDTMVHHFRRDPSSAKKSAEALVDLCKDKGFPLWRISGEIPHAWSSAKLGQPKLGVFDEDIKQWIESWEGHYSAKLFRPYWFGLLAETCLIMARPEDGLKAVKEGSRCSAETEEHWWDAELNRLEGELMLLRPQQDPMDATKCFKKAFHIAEGQKAKSLQLRAAISLARVRDQQGEKEEARRSLEGIYHSFDENLEMEDLREAKQLLDELQ